MRRGACPDRRRGILIVQQRDEDGRIVAVHEGDLHDAQGRTVQAFAFEADEATAVGDQQAGEVAAVDRPGCTQGAFSQDAVGGADAPVGTDQRGHHPCPAQPVAGGAADQGFGRGGEVLALQHDEAPDEHVALVPGAGDMAGDPVATEHEACHLCAAITPGDPPGIAEPGHAIAFQWQSGRGRKAAEQRFECIVRTDQSAGAIGDRHGIAARLRDGAGKGPVDGVRLGCSLLPEQPPTDDRSARDDADAEEPGGHRNAADEKQDEARRRNCGGAGNENRGALGVEAGRDREGRHVGPVIAG